MWHLILQLPHPTLNELIISAEIFMIFWPMRLLQLATENELCKEVRRIRLHHRKTHMSHARWCREDDCAKLADQIQLPSPLELAALLAVEVAQESQSHQEIDPRLTDSFL